MALGAGAGLAMSPGRRLARAEGGAAWGAWPDFAKAAEIPEELRPRNILEVFVQGGISPWETLYTVEDPAYGQAAGLMWHTFLDGPDSVPYWHGTCVGSDAPLVQPWHVDDLGALVGLGPFAHPLRTRADIVDRMRLHVLSHELVPHDVARALAFTGTRLGSPRMHGMGAAVQRHAAAVAPLELPAAYVIAEGYDGFATSVGRHPVASRPPVLRVTGSDHFGDTILAYAVPGARRDLLSYYAHRFEYRLRSSGSGLVSRAPAFDDYRFALSMRDEVDFFADILAGGAFAVGEVERCGLTGLPDLARSQLRLAAHLLNLPDETTRHVTVIERAYDRIGVSNPDAFDTHTDHVRLSARKFPYTWSRLIEAINEPGEDDPTKIDLERTLVVINTEFGRSPGVQGTDGRNHWPYAYVTAMFGGPVGLVSKGIVGAIDHTAAAVEPLHPATTRAASLAALGIFPFAAEAFSASDVLGAASELDAALVLKDRVLGMAS